MEEQELLALLESILGGGLAEDQQNVLAQQMQEADWLRKTQQPGMTEANGLIFAPSPLANIAATMKQVVGGKQGQDITGPTPQDPLTGQPISQYGNLKTANEGVRAQLMSKIADYLRSKKPAPAAQSAQAMAPEAQWGVKWPWEG